MVDVDEDEDDAIMMPATMAPETAPEWAEETMLQLPGNADAAAPPQPQQLETETMAETVPQLWTAGAAAAEEEEEEEADGSSGTTLPQVSSSSQPEEETQVQPAAAILPAWARNPSSAAYTFGNSAAPAAPTPAVSGGYVLGTRATDTTVVAPAATPSLPALPRPTAKRAAPTPAASSRAVGSAFSSAVVPHVLITSLSAYTNRLLSDST